MPRIGAQFFCEAPVKALCSVYQALRRAQIAVDFVCEDDIRSWRNEQATVQLAAGESAVFRLRLADREQERPGE